MKIFEGIIAFYELEVVVNMLRRNYRRQWVKPRLTKGDVGVAGYFRHLPLLILLSVLAAYSNTLDYPGVSCNIITHVT